MNELDWWIASQWEMFKIKEGKTGLEFNKTDKEGNVLTVDRTQKWNKLRAKTDLKEMYIVRYADYTEVETMPKLFIKANSLKRFQISFSA